MCLSLSNLTKLHYKYHYIAKSFSSHKNTRSEDALAPLLYFVGVRLRQMCDCVACFRPCQSNADLRVDWTLVTCHDASNRLSHVTWVLVSYALFLSAADAWSVLAKAYQTVPDYWTKLCFVLILSKYTRFTNRLGYVYNESKQLREKQIRAWILDACRS